MERKIIILFGEDKTSINKFIENIKNQEGNYLFTHDEIFPIHQWLIKESFSFEILKIPINIIFIVSSLFLIPVEIRIRAQIHKFSFDDPISFSKNRKTFFDLYHYKNIPKDIRQKILMI